MSYNPTTWESGDVISSAKLNKMEQGIANAGGGGVFIVKINWNDTYTEGTLDKTWQEIHDASLTNVVVFVGTESETTHVLFYPYVIGVYIESGDYYVNAVSGTDMLDFTVNSADGYPAHSE